MKAASLIAAGMLVSAALHTSAANEFKRDIPGNGASAPAPADGPASTPAEPAMTPTSDAAGPPAASPSGATRAQQHEPAKQDAHPDAAGAAGAAAASAQSRPAETPQKQTLCTFMKSVARARGLPFGFFARLIWRESRFRADVVGPRTRNGQRALGIAQFMPDTAAQRGLTNPLDPFQALPESAEFLKQLWTTFGNLGLAAAAYNAGPGRVRKWIGGLASLPRETRRYVRAITGRGVDQWVVIGHADAATTFGQLPNCHHLLAAVKTRPPLRATVVRHRSTPVHTARPWGVQLCAGFSRDQVLERYARLARKLHAALAGTDADLVRTKQSSRGTHPFYQVRVGAPTRAEADHICARVRSAGGACVVMRNQTTSIKPI